MTYPPVRIRKDFTLAREVKVQKGEETSAKQQTAQRCCSAFNHWGRPGRRAFLPYWNLHALAGQMQIKALV